MKPSLFHSFTPSLLIAASAALLSSCNHFNLDNGPIRLNQVGFAPLQEMTATIVLPDSTVDPYATSVVITNAIDDTVWIGVPAVTMNNPVSGKRCQIIDFSALEREGDYTLFVNNPAFSASAPFVIREHPYKELTRAALRAYYHQRASMATEEPYAEGYARPNKYIVNSGYTMGVWLMAYEFNRDYFDTLHLNIPVTGNPSSVTSPCPDMLAEAMYNIRWMMTMQDLDGGVYHKLTTPNFEKFIRPDECQQQRYVVLKTTAATLDFAATMALAARVYAPYDPEFCAQATDAAIRAYAWAQAHPEVYYDQPAMNKQFKPEITTGAYDDFDVTDEFFWAATELHLLTKAKEYALDVIRYKSQIAGYLPAVWGNVGELAMLEILMHRDLYQGFPDEFQDALLHHLEPYLDEATTVSVFLSPYGNREEDFFWGCNSEGCCWRGVECLYAYRLTGDQRYRINAERCLNYILGQNATGFCYVTGFGTHPTSHPHHRLSYSHAKGTLPGFLAGGPNPARQDAETDGVKYPKNVPADESYLDYQPSYASNEVTINWNVTLFALTAGLDAIR